MGYSPWGRKKLDMTEVTSVQFSHSVVSDSLRPHRLQHARPPCPQVAGALFSAPNFCMPRGPWPSLMTGI